MSDRRRRRLRRKFGLQEPDGTLQGVSEGGTCHICGKEFETDEALFDPEQHADVDADDDGVTYEPSPLGMVMRGF